MTLTKKDLDLALDALDMAVELLETVWLKDPGNTRQDTREIRANIKRMWELVGRLVVHAPEHHMAFSMPSHHQLKIGGTGSSARLRRHLDELGVSDNSARRGKRATGTARNGAEPTNGHTLKSATRNGGPHCSPVTFRTSHDGRSPRSGGRE